MNSWVYRSVCKKETRASGTDGPDNIVLGEVQGSQKEKKKKGKKYARIHFTLSRQFGVVDGMTLVCALLG